jgi:hypothetical protein
MTQNKSISPLRQRMLDDMRMRKLKPGTQKAYVHAVRQLAKFLKRPPDTATAEDLRDFQLYLVDSGATAAMLNNLITGLKFFYRTTLGTPERLSLMSPVREPEVSQGIPPCEQGGTLVACRSVGSSGSRSP